MRIMNFFVLSVSIITILDICGASDKLLHSISSEHGLNDNDKAISVEAYTQFIFILRCEVSKPVKWICQKYATSKENSYIPQDKTIKFGISLTIIGLDTFRGNKCFCYLNSTTDIKLYNNTMVASVFVYEIDTNHTVIEGGTFTLICELQKKIYFQSIFKIEWVLPKEVQWDKFRMSEEYLSRGRKILTIRDAESTDSGHYTCQFVYYSENEPQETIQINSTYKMTVISKDVYFKLVNKDNPYNYNLKPNSTALMGVCYRGLPTKTEWINSNYDNIINNKKYQINFAQDGDAIYSYLNIKNVSLRDTGKYLVYLPQRLGYEEFNLTVEDVPIVSVNDVFVQTNEIACIQCKVESYPKAVVTWTFEPCSSWNFCSAQPIEVLSDHEVSSHEASSIEYIYNLTFVPNSSGIIRCKAVNTIGTALGESLVIIRETNENMTIYGIGDDDFIKLDDSVTINCAAFAYSFSDEINWYYANDRLINETENIVVNSSLNGYYYTKSLNFKEITISDQGQYECRARLRNSNNTKSIYKIIRLDIPRFRTNWIAGSISFFVILASLVIYLFVRVKRKSKLLDELKAAGLANFEEGAVDQINPSLTLDEQADLLPYDHRFEFPKDKLKLGQLLGAGAFGTVFKAYAEGIKPNEKETVVAVKMVKRDANNEVIKALVSELKIMVHIGRHLNVVNLLGAVTKNIAKRELMVIVEYCHFGNIRNFLINNRKKFINQIDPNTGKINNSLATQTGLDNFQLNRNSKSNTQSEYLNPSSIRMKNSDLYESQVKEVDVLETVQEDDSDISLSDNNIQLYNYQCPNYKSDSTDGIAVTTTDLVSWTFQLASGMEYLSSMNVLHGDLAARNILLCEGYIVKICDFGLARSIYKGDNYKKQGDALLPIKWLALESLSDHIFSIYTDIWSFGIVMWELFSLATVPYPDIHSYQNLYKMLKNGYRMEKPVYANDDLYYIMLECWSANPEKRPLFSLLKEKFAVILGEKITNHYMVMNEPYLEVNAENINLKDYLTLLDSSAENAPLSRRYIDCHITSEKYRSLNEYLPMISNIKVDSHSVMDINSDHEPLETTLTKNLKSPVNKSPQYKHDNIKLIPVEEERNQEEDIPKLKSHD